MYIGMCMLCCSCSSVDGCMIAGVVSLRHTVARFASVLLVFLRCVIIVCQTYTQLVRNSTTACMLILVGTAAKQATSNRQHHKVRKQHCCHTSWNDNAYVQFRCICMIMKHELLLTECRVH
jgi:hypothetical protein